MRTLLLLCALASSLSFQIRSLAQETKDPLDPVRWEKTIQGFEKRDQDKPPPRDAVLFVGSSSIVKWELDKSFPGLAVINRGFGGSHVADSVHYAPRLVVKYKPRIVVFYAGDNDVAAGKSPERIRDDFKAFADIIQRDLPRARLIFLSIKPSIARWKLYDQQCKANTLIAEYCRDQKMVSFKDVGMLMLGQDGKPRPELFVKDGLHLSKEGYALWATLVGPLLSDRPREKTPRVWNVEDLMRLRTIRDVDVAPDGKRVVFAVRQAVMEGKKSEYLTHVYLSEKGIGSVALTQGEESCEQPRWSPDGKWIAFLSERSGKRNLWALPTNGGEARRLSDVKSAVISYRWSPDSAAVAFVAADPTSVEEEKAVAEKRDVRVVDENVKHHRLHLVRLQDGLAGKHQARVLTPDDFSVGRGYDWSPDARTIVFSQVRTPSPDDWGSADLSLIDVAEGKLTASAKLVHSKAAEHSPHYSPDGKWIAYVASDDPPTWAGSGRVHVIAADGKGKPRMLAETPDGWSRYSELIGWSADGRQLYVAEQKGTTTVLLTLPLEGSIQELPAATNKRLISPGVTLNATRTHFGFAMEDAYSPPEAYVTAVTEFNPQQRSNVNRELKAEAPPVDGVSQLESWKSADGQTIEGLVTYPVGYDKSRRYPLLLVIHGGPMGVFGQSYAGTPNPYPVTLFASRGYAVLRCNVRGSSGYGKKFRYANYGDWGGGDYKDLMAGVDHLIERGLADPDRLGVMGWSYGGFMTSWVITQTKRFKAASVGAGVTNLMSFTGTADIPSFLPDYFGGEFWDRPKAYLEHSAMFHVKEVSTPTLIQHGERDDRVPLSQGRELYNALKRQGCPVRMVVYPRTPHGIEEPKLLLDAMRRNLDWFEEHLARGK